MYTRLHMKYQLFLSGFNKTRIFLTDFREKKNSYIKLHENPSTRSDGQTDITKHTPRNFTDATKHNADSTSRIYSYTSPQTL
jgi:hypothetical protein